VSITKLCSATEKLLADMRSDLFCRKKTKIEMEKAPASALDLIARPIDADVSCDARCLQRPILTTTDMRRGQRGRKHDVVTTNSEVYLQRFNTITDISWTDLGIVLNNLSPLVIHDKIKEGAPQLFFIANAKYV
jgi:hypothetical protein